MQTLSLNDPLVSAWRTQALGKDAPWEPTLIRERNGEVRAWTGWGMAPMLVRELGVKDSAKVLQALGIERKGEVQPSVRQHKAPKLVSRKGFLQLGAGIAAAAAVFSTGSLTGASPAAASGLPKGAKLHNVQATTLAPRMKRMLSVSDVTNILDKETLNSLRTGKTIPTPKGMAEGAVLLQHSGEGTTKIDGVEVPGQVYAIVQREVQVPNAGTTTNTIVAFPQSETYLHFQQNDHPSPYLTSATLFEFGSEDGHFKTLEESFDGIRSEPVPAGISGAATTSADPCGGCGSASRMYLAGSCDTSDAAGCVFTGVGCAACLAGCVGSFGLLCVACVVSACGPALRTCCARQGAGVCRTCGPVI
ncbi:hypothetical protein GCM10027403_07120 [Arthrobacter tecti]